MTMNTFGISSYQRLLIGCALDPDVPDSFHSAMTLAWAYRVTPALKQRVLKRAFDKLVQRHDTLRLRFVQEGTNWRALILPEHPTGLRIEDLSHLSDADEQEAIVRLAQQPMTALSDVLFETVLIQSGAHGSVLLMRAHHAITDGYGVSVLVEDLLKFAFGMPLVSHAPSHADFITLQTRRVARNKAAKDTFWNDMLADPPPKPNMGCQARGLAPASAHTTGPCGAFVNILTPDQSRALDAKVKASGLSAFSYVYAAYGEAICAMGGVDEACICTVLGRQDTALARFVGPDIQEFALRYRATPGDITLGATRIRDMLSGAAAHLPYDAFHDPQHDLHKRLHATRTLCGGFFIAMSVSMTRATKEKSSTKLVDAAQTGKVSLGYMTIEQVPLPFDTVFSEMLLAVTQDDTGPNMSLRYATRAYDRAEVDLFVRHMVDRLGV